MLEESFDLALRQGDWKYVEESQATWPAEAPLVEEALFNLRSDPSEQSNLIKKHPSKVAELKSLLAEIQNGKGMRGIK